MAKIYTLVSTKGGVGKTTLGANLGGILADMGQRVLLIDADDQCSLTNYYDLQDTADHGLVQFVTQMDAAGCISRTAIPGLDLIVCDDNSKTLNDWIRQSMNHFFFLKAAVKKVEEEYDVILIDTKGTEGSGELQELAIRAADELLAPIPPSFMSLRAFTENTLPMLERLAPPPGLATGNEIPPLRGVIYMQDRTADSISAATSIRQYFFQSDKGKNTILDTHIPQMSAYQQAVSRKMPVHRYEVKRRTDSATASAHDTMLTLVHELLPHLSTTSPRWTTEQLKGVLS